MTTEETKQDTGTSTESGTDSKGTEPKQRTVGQILELGTFQGCTDAEIQSVIDYEVQQALADAEIRTRQATLITQMNEEAEAYKKAAAETNDILRQLLSKDLNLGTVGADGFPAKQGGEA